MTAIFETSEDAEAAAIELQRMGLKTGQVRLAEHERDPAQAGEAGSDTRPVALRDVAQPVSGRYWLEVNEEDLALSTVIDVLQRHGGHIY